MDNLIVTIEEAGMRLDQFLKGRLPTFSRSYFQELIEKKLVLVNQELVKKRTLLKEGDEIEIEFILNEECALIPQKMEFEILYEDEALIALNKPANMVVHPGCNNPSNTLVNGLLYHIHTLHNQESLRPGIIHRLDKDTTGIILCAKTRQIQEKMVALFAAREIEKVYLAITLSKPSVTEIRTFIGRDPKRRQEMTVLEDHKGKEAITQLEVLHANEKLSLVRLYPKTGRTHQLRVHLKHIGTPILGDPVYGSKSSNQHYGIHTQMLHAYSLKFIHPNSGQELYLTAPLPKKMQEFLKKIGFSNYF